MDPLLSPEPRSQIERWLKETAIFGDLNGAGAFEMSNDSFEGVGLEEASECIFCGSLCTGEVKNELIDALRSFYIDSDFDGGDQLLGSIGLKIKETGRVAVGVQARQIAGAHGFPAYFLDWLCDENGAQTLVVKENEYERMITRVLKWVL